MIKEIVPLCTGYICYQELGGELLPAISWLIAHKEGFILVDTGMCDTERACNYHHRGSRQEEGFDIRSQLLKRGLKPSDIGMIIFTHLHWDHCANIDAFPNAELVVSRDELNFALDPLPPYYRSYEINLPGIRPNFLGKNFKTISRPTSIIPKITIIPTPGHTPGHISVMVEGKKNVYALAGDAVFTYENLQPDFETGIPVRPLRKFVDAEKMWSSLLFLASSGAIVLPSHERRVLQNSLYM
ncbi:MAG: N-acyl homoserine lactonase family protein [Nitrososphaerota archaeon]